MPEKLDLDALLKTGQAELIAPEEVKFGDNLIGVIRLGTQVAIHCVFAYLDDMQEYLDVIASVDLNGVNQGKALFTALSELDERFSGKLPQKTLGALDSLLKLQILGKKTAKRFGAKVLDETELHERLRPLAQLPLESYELYRLNKTTTEDTKAISALRDSTMRTRVVEGIPLPKNCFPIDLFGPLHREKN